MSQINTELGRSSTATISLDTAESGGYVAINTASSSTPNNARPAAMSEWYSYDHSATAAFEGLLGGDPAGVPQESCALPYNIPVYKNGPTSAPQPGEQLYNDISLTSPYPTPVPGAYYKYYDNVAKVAYSLFLLDQGYIEGVFPC